MIKASRSLSLLFSALSLSRERARSLFLSSELVLQSSSGIRIYACTRLVSDTGFPPSIDYDVPRLSKGTDIYLLSAAAHR